MIDRLLHILIVIIGLFGAFSILVQDRHLHPDRTTIELNYVDRGHQNYEYIAHERGSLENREIDTLGAE